MKTIRSVIRKGMAAGGLLLAFAGSSVWGHSPDDQPLLSIVQPAFNSTQPGAMVVVRVHFGPRAIQRTFHAEMDGTNITNLFAPRGQCDNWGNCDMQAVLPAATLLTGTNIVTAGVSGPNEAAAVDRTSFEFTGPSARGEPVSRMIPAVSIQSVKLPVNANTNDPNSYQIVVGPGPGFPQRIYTTHGLSCSAGINSMQVLVLQPQTLAPESKVGSGSGQSCLGDAVALATFLKGLPKGDIVIMNSFLGLMSNVDTTAIGGGKYTSTKPYYYNAIGMAGGAAGSAYESYQPNASHTPRLGRDHLPPLVGSLMLDTAQRYFFVPSSYPDLKVTPGERSKDGCASVEYTGTLRHCADKSGAGGFWIVAIDRLSGAVTDDYVLETNSNDPLIARKEMDDLAYLLTGYYKSNDLLILTTFGTPIGAKVPVTHYLYNALSTLGGNPYRLANLTSTTSSYLLISSPDPGYVSQHYPLQRFSTAKDEDHGPTHVLLAKNRLNQYVAEVGAEDQLAAQPFGFQWSKVLFQQPQDWPAWSAAEQRAYADLTSSANHYPDVRSTLGCGGSGTCQPVRSYYVGGIGTGGTEPGVLKIPYASLVYYANSDYSQDDFQRVLQQLKIEQGYLTNVYTVYAQFMTVSAGTQDNLQLQLTNVANSIENSLVNNQTLNSSVSVEQLNKASAVAGLFSILPGVGPAAGAVSASLNAVAVLTPVGETPIPSQYSVTLAQLRNKTATIGTDMQASVVTAFAGVVQDWGKFSTIGAGVGSQQAPWYMCVNCVGSNVPLASLPLFALGAKQRFYAQLMPAAYSSDEFIEKRNSDPRTYKTWVKMGDSYGCYTPYYKALPDGFWSYPSINAPDTHDVFIVTQTRMSDYPSDRNLKVLSFPSQPLLDQLFQAPGFTGTSPLYRLAGGAGLTHDDLMPTWLGGYLPWRGGYLPGNPDNGYCKTSH